MSETSEPKPDSPFLPGTQVQFAWDSVCLGAMKTCPRLYQLTILEGWTPKGEAIHLRFGIEYHQALHDYELAKIDGADHQDAVRKTLIQLFTRIVEWHPVPEKESEKKKSKDNLTRTIVWYLDQFKDDPCKTLIMKDGDPAIELSYRYELSWGPGNNSVQEFEHGTQPYLLCGHLDRVVDYLGDTFVMDRKTSGFDLTPSYFSQFEPNNQITGYTLAAKVIFDTTIRGVIIDAANVSPGFTREGHPKKPFERSFTYRTDDQLQEWIDDLQYWLSAAEAYAKNNYWPMNDTSCDKFGGCRFRGICSKSPQVREQYLKSSFTKLPENERWNPLKTR